LEVIVKIRTLAYTCILALAYACGTTRAHAACVKEYIIGAPEGGTMLWNGFLDANCDCPIEGNNCLMTVICDNVTVMDNGDWWKVEGTILSRSAHITPAGGQPFTRSLGYAYYVFPPGRFSFGENECGAHPALHVPMDGVVADNQGHFVANVLK
jgi:hypothetical protein